MHLRLPKFNTWRYLLSIDSSQIFSHNLLLFWVFLFQLVFDLFVTISEKFFVASIFLRNWYFLVKLSSQKFFGSFIKNKHLNLRQVWLKALLHFESAKLCVIIFYNEIYHWTVCVTRDMYEMNIAEMLCCLYRLCHWFIVDARFVPEFGFCLLWSYGNISYQ